MRATFQFLLFFLLLGPVLPPAAALIAPTAATLAESTQQATRSNTGPATNSATPLIKMDAGRQQGYGFFRKYFFMGGPFMYPLLLLSIVGLGIVLERFWYFYRCRLDIDALTGEVARALQEEGIRGAIGICEASDTMGSRILGDGLRLHEAGIERVEKGIETRGGIEIGLLERGLSILAAVANLAPLLGFLGTVTGMIVSFQKIADADAVSAKLVSVGIFEALITTAAGLIVAIPAFAFHNVFVHKIDRFATEVEKASSIVVNTLILAEKKRQDGA